VPGQPYNNDVGTFWHGTHVAGIVAAAANGIGTVGIAPEATLVGVKVLHNGSGSFEWVMNGLLYAARPLNQGGAGANVINMSLGAAINYRDSWGSKPFRDAFRDLVTAWDRATGWAYQQDVTVIVAAGNGGRNLDEQKEIFMLPAQSQHAISVSATGPHGWALGQTNFHRPAYYTDHGKSLVDLAAPGGTIGLFLIDGVNAFCPFGGTLQFCETFDLILSTSRGAGASNTSYSWAQGTSMAAPAVAGVAALVIQKSGGRANPAQVRTALQRGAIDHGKPGKDEYYGHGWVNALRSVQ
jgi:subtilisin family serine protease